MYLTHTDRKQNSTCEGGHRTLLSPYVAHSEIQAIGTFIVNKYLNHTVTTPKLNLNQTDNRHKLNLSPSVQAQSLLGGRMVRAPDSVSYVPIERVRNPSRANADKMSL